MSRAQVRLLPFPALPADIDGLTPQLIAGHEQGFAAIKAERSRLPVGVTLNLIDFQPATDRSPYERTQHTQQNLDSGPGLDQCRSTNPAREAPADHVRDRFHCFGGQTVLANS